MTTTTMNHGNASARRLAHYLHMIHAKVKQTLHTILRLAKVWYL